MNINYGKHSIDRSDIRAVTNVLRSSHLTQGKAVLEFEKALAEYCGAKYAVSFCNGTASLHAAYAAAGVGTGDQIITSPITFVATANAAMYLGARPIFAEIDQNGNMSPNYVIPLAKAPEVKAIVPVHYAGLPCDMEFISRAAKSQDKYVIEDASHALGAEYRGSKIGSCAFSDMTTFSFHPVKNVTTGEGGAVTTNSEELYEKLLLFRSHGIVKDPSKMIDPEDSPHYQQMVTLGYNYRMSDINAALGTSQMAKLEQFLEKGRR